MHTEVTELRGAREDGLAEGLRQGLEQGLEQGQQEGERNILVRLLQKRFGPLSDAQRARIQSASSAEIEAWSERLFDASTAAEVLGA